MESSKPEIHVLLHDIRSAHNVGSMFRTGDAIGVTRFLFSGFTPRPLDRFKRPVKEIAKTALGAEQHVPWGDVTGPLEAIAEAKKKGFTVVGIEQDARAIDYKSFIPKGDVLIVMGPEVEGIDPEIRDACDVLLEIPMNGMKESLNVSVAFGVALFQIFDR